MSDRPRRRKSTYEMIQETRDKIQETENRLAQLKQELDSLYSTLYDEFSSNHEANMRKMFDLISAKHIPLSAVIELLEKNEQ